MTQLFPWIDDFIFLFFAGQFRLSCWLMYNIKLSCTVLNHSLDRQVDLKVPVVVRLEGTNVDQGKRILKVKITCMHSFFVGISAKSSFTGNFRN